MAVTIHPTPETEALLEAQAKAQGLAVEEWLLNVAELATKKKTPNLSDLLLNSPFAGSNLNLDRSQEYSQPLDLE